MEVGFIDLIKEVTPPIAVILIIIGLLILGVRIVPDWEGHAPDENVSEMHRSIVMNGLLFIVLGMVGYFIWWVAIMGVFLAVIMFFAAVYDF